MRRYTWVRGWVWVCMCVAILILARPAQAQGPITLQGTRSSGGAMREFHFAETARRAASAPRVAETPVNVPRMRLPETTSAKVPAQPSAPRAPAQPRDVSPAPARNFLGLDDPNFTIPPDTMGAVGVDHVVTMLNSEVRVQDKEGVEQSRMTLNTFWGRSGMFDPRIHFDMLSHRWLATAVRNAVSVNSELCLAWSQTSSPLLGWFTFCFDADSTNQFWADFPQMGYNKDWVVITVNMFPIVSGSTRGQVYVLDKPSLYAGSLTGYVFADSTIPTGMVPAVTLDASLTTENLIRHYSSGSGLLLKSFIAGSPPAAPSLTLNTVYVTSILGAWSIPVDEVLPQADGARLIDLIDPRLHNAVVRTVNGVTRLWCTQNIELQDGVNRRYAAQWWELDANPYSATVFQQGRVQDPTATQTNGGFHYGYPSLAVNKDGDMLIGFSRFSSTTYASAAYALRYHSDPAGTTRDPVVFKAGEGYYEKTFSGSINRWGDYSHTVVDPVGDINFWTVQEYAATPVGTGNGSGRWGVWWANVRLSVTTPGDYFFPVIQREQ